MSDTITVLIENASFIAIFLLCLYGVVSVRKHNKTVPGADLLLIGFLLYASYGMLCWTAPGFNGSFIADWSRTATLNGGTLMHFIAQALRLGLILIVVGMFKIGSGLKI